MEQKMTAISREAFKRALPIGRSVNLVMGDGRPVREGSNPRTVHAHRSFGIEFKTADGHISRSEFNAGDKYVCIDGYGWGIICPDWPTGTNAPWLIYTPTDTQLQA